MSSVSEPQKEVKHLFSGLFHVTKIPRKSHNRQVDWWNIVSGIAYCSSRAKLNGGNVIPLDLMKLDA